MKKLLIPFFILLAVSCGEKRESLEKIPYHIPYGKYCNFAIIDNYLRFDLCDDTSAQFREYGRIYDYGIDISRFDVYADSVLIPIDTAKFANQIANLTMDLEQRNNEIVALKGLISVLKNQLNHKNKQP